MSSMLQIDVNISAFGVVEAFRRAPEIMHRIVGEGVWRGAEEVAREARRNAPSVFGTLANSIKAEKVSDLHWHTAPGVNYGAAVEEGTKPGYTPNLLNLRMYIQASMIRTKGFRWGKAGGAKRQGQEDDIAERTDALSWYIRAHGTKAQPYMKPAADTKQSRVIDLIREATHRGVKESMQ